MPEKLILNRAYLLCLVLSLALLTNEAFAQETRVCSIGNHAFLKSFEETASRQKDDGSTFHVPVVFHLVYNGDTPPIHHADIFTQLKILNEDFNRLNADTISTLDVFKSSAGSSNIIFFLATGDNGAAIIERKTSHGPFANNDLHFSALGGSDAWDTRLYLNVWIADLAGGIFGYGTPPGTDPALDGVAIDYNYFGKGNSTSAPFDGGRTLTHEVGHWLGLRHPWGDGGCNSDDGIEDTPAQDGPVSGCDLTYQSCGQLAMVQNFMGVSQDNCMNLFTQGQCSRMREALLNERSMIPQHNGIITTALEQAVESMQVFPLPIKDFHPLTIEGAYGHTGDFRLFDLNGIQREIRVETTDQDRFEVDLSAIENGTFLLISREKNGWCRKIIINRN